MEKYLKWRCKMNWHPKYYKYIDDWINNILPYQMEYFKKEKQHLINNGVYGQED